MFHDESSCVPADANLECNSKGFSITVTDSDMYEQVLALTEDQKHGLVTVGSDCSANFVTTTDDNGETSTTVKVRNNITFWQYICISYSLSGITWAFFSGCPY